MRAYFILFSGKLLAREWLKYRYGVFEENGFKTDLLYPAYCTIPGKSEIRITDCTNSNIPYIFKNPTSGEVCDMDLVRASGFCRTAVDEESAANVTSSLMYFHKDIPKMEHICGKDGRPHHSTARNKQNALYNGGSIWDVVKKSDDFKKNQQQPANPVPKAIQFSYVQESNPRLVVLLENSDNLQGNVRNAFRHPVCLETVLLRPATQKQVSLYTYNSDVTEALPYAELPAQERSDLGPFADFGFPATSICTSCGLAKATQILLQNSKVEKASILLITASPLDKVPEFSEKLKDAGICLHVLRFTGEDNPLDQTYDAVEGSFHCFSLESLQSSLDVVSIFDSMSRFLNNNVPQFNDDFEIKTVNGGLQRVEEGLLGVSKFFDDKEVLSFQSCSQLSSSSQKWRKPPTSFYRTVWSTRWTGSSRAKDFCPCSPSSLASVRNL
ncbi:hypothetical protein AVEN_7424-1 [Araneus ventricosus]|uniref:Calcium-activated chloride channel N-terminal domain-containing protein n=1 Tax=Araneus ventricosus TaxID=182803 RepID=A0A4Y2H1R7_ARAVE|nr:hypothetical protein AVEN_7424-1 [Araneus ventricosus]